MSEMVENVKNITIFILCSVILNQGYSNADKPPHIIFILADDLGWNDVGYHGSNQIPTPNIDALAFSGLILNNYYVAPICSPSRSALMTGKHPVHTGMQHGVIYGAEPWGLPLAEKLLPQYLKGLGYATHLVGKWHLGSYKRVYTPLYRGFDSHIGFWTGRIDYFDHTSIEKDAWGFDIRRGMDVAHDLFGKYATDLYTQEAVKVIENHDKTKPLFLMVSHSAVHSGNTYNPLPAPDSAVAKFANITNYYRQRFAGMLSKLDESVGEVVQALGDHSLLEDSIIVFSTDNGGPAAGFNQNAASNFPLRGVKNTLWEGGVRGACLLWSPFLEKRYRVANQMMHISDWLPTLYTAAGGNSSIMDNIDGFDLWNALSKDEPSKRSEVLHNIDDIEGSASVTSGKWKLHKGTNYKGQWDDWYGPNGRKGTYDWDGFNQCKSANALRHINMLPDLNVMKEMRTSATIVCDMTNPVICEPLKSPCLFNIEQDPCENRNLADSEIEQLKIMLNLLEAYNRTTVPPLKVPADPRGNPKYWNYIYTNFGDFQIQTSPDTV